MYVWNPMIQTKEYLFALLKKVSLPEERFLKAVKHAGINGAFNSSHWTKYLELICKLTNKPACPVCGAPMEYRRRSITTTWNPSGQTCIAFSSHAMIETVNDREILKWLGYKCKCGYYLTECKSCIEKACRDNIERTDKEYLNGITTRTT